jgi:MEDS: MEthanogen/methylotroph, DcmR Sensory domain
MSAGSNGQIAERQHVVQFYGSAEELTACAGRYLSEGLLAGEKAVVAATGKHCMAFAAYLAAAGVSLRAAQDAGDLTWVDARDLLRRMLVGGRPDPDRFDAVIGGLLRRATGAGRPVRVFGEMVALLWDAGQVSAAIELESRWNDLAARLPFSLYCGYLADRSADGELTEALARICGLHSAVLEGGQQKAGAGAAPAGAGVAVRDFPLHLDSPRDARHFMLDALGGQLPRTLADDAALVMTELTANAVIHAKSAFTVAVRTDDHTVRMAVSDARTLQSGHGGRLPAAGGRGLGLVDMVAGRWAAEPLPRGKVVWAELQGGKGPRC